VTLPHGGRAARFVAALCMLSVVLVFAAFQFGTERTWWIELGRYLPFPAYLAPAGVAVLLSFGLPARWRIAAWASLTLVLTGIMGLQVHRGEDGQAPLRVMTYNIKAYQADERPGGFAQIAWEIALHDPDVLVMQDAGAASRLEELPPPLRTALGSRGIHFSGQYMIASRYPMQDCREGDISFPDEEHHYTRCTITAHGVAVDVVTAHLLSPREGLNATRYERLDGLAEWKQNHAMRFVQARKLASDLTGNPRPLILAGDLNAPESSPVIAALRDSGLRDSFASAGLGYGNTYGHALRTRFSFLRIDHIMVSPQIGVKDSIVGGADASAHRPVIADLWLKRD
jgi:endonuclease/exonuclease/phosphatase (EEP) superfamily protein YafD